MDNETEKEITFILSLGGTEEVSVEKSSCF